MSSDTKGPRISAGRVIGYHEKPLKDYLAHGEIIHGDIIAIRFPDEGNDSEDD